MKVLISLVFVGLTIPMFGQTAQLLKDRNGIPIIEISDKEVSREEVSQDMIWVRISVTVKNISDSNLGDFMLDVTSIEKDGSRRKASEADGASPHGLPVCYSAREIWESTGMNRSVSCNGIPESFKRGSSLRLARYFNCDAPCTGNLELSIDPAWQSPGDLKLRAAKQKRDDARYAELKAEAVARANTERVKVRAACMGIYKSTADKKISDLTVKEEQQVRACQSLGLYSAP